MSKLRMSDISEILHLIWSVRPDVNVWAFGSRMTENFRKDSNLDLFVEGTTPLSSRDIALIRDRLSQSSMSFPIDAICKENATEEILQNIKSKLIKLELSTTAGQ